MSDLQRYLVDEAIEDFEQGRINRRDALRVLTGLVGAFAGAQLLAACKKKREQAPATPPAPAATKPQVAPDDPDIIASAASFPGDGGVTLAGYVARPAKPGATPAIVLVCHENRGLTPHIEDVTRRVAKAGYIGMAVDLLSREGGTAKLATDDVPGVLGKVPPERHVGDFVSALAHARTQPGARADRVGMTGFCFGGGVTWRVAVALPDLRAAVPFYGMPVDVADVPKINAAVLGIYAERDDRINQAVPAIEQAMQANGKTFKKIVYPGTDHAFHNDTRERYVPAAAKAAWNETLAWFAQYLA